MTVTTSPARVQTFGATLARGAVIGALVAAVANTIVYLVGDAGSPVEVITGWQSDGAHLALAAALGSSAFFVAVAAVGLSVVERYRRDGFRDWAVLAAVLAALTIVPVTQLDVPTDSRVTLIVMHLTVAGSCVVGQTLARRRA